ncbi:MAG TPA: PQQ-dependent sugar dehydrogenase, partial [Phycisphaerae bacterium]|nr:PQQ-dependent sugar dehydrogenase [Phycisphaerae bacterium]
MSRIRRIGISAALSVVVGVLSHQSARAQTTPLTTRIVGSGFSNPLFVTAPPGDTSRIFVVEQRGNPNSTSARIMIIDLTTNPPTTLGTPFITVTGVSAQNEEGLLGLAFAPDYSSTGRFYVYYTVGNNCFVARGTVSGNPNVANSTLTTILTITHPNNNHNGGWIGFGPDGYLYIGVGDGGSEYDPSHYGQNKNVLLAKILRIDVSGATYSIPPTNPYVGGGAVPELFHWGVRNPWRDSFDRLTGDLYIGDVGQDNYEEVDIAPAGSSNLNFGWSCMEANHCCPTCSGPCGGTCVLNCTAGSGLTCPVA